MFFHQTKSNSFDDASIILEGTSVRDKVNHLWQSVRLLNIFTCPTKASTEKQKRSENFKYPAHCVQELVYARKHSCVP